MLDRDLDRLVDIQIHCDHLLGLFKGRDLDAFLADRTLQWATERLLEIVGEAAGALSDEARAEITHDWSGLRGLRNVLAHQYGRIEPERVYRVVREEIPRLRKDIEPFLDLV